MNETTDATALLAPLWRFKWFIVGVGLAVALATYVYYGGQSVSYQAATTVNMANGAEEQGVAPSEPTPRKGARRRKETVTSPSMAGANVINSPVIHGNVISQLRQETTLPAYRPVAEAALRGSYVAKGAETGQIVSIVATAPTGAAAALIANTAAELFVQRTNTDFLLGVKTAIGVTRAQLNAVEVNLASGAPPPKATKGKKAEAERGNATSWTLQAANLTTQLNHLQSELAISSVKQLGRANGLLAAKQAADPKQNAIFGFLIGISLAALAAYTLNRFDRRLRTLAGIESALGAQVLSAMPSVRRPLIMRAGELHPTGPLREPLRRLHTTLRLGANGNRGSRPRSLLFLSPDAADGKSTVAAGLALVQRDAGEQVSLIEADFRRPVQARLLGVPLSGGLLEVLSGTLTLEEGLQRVGLLHSPAEVQPVGAPPEPHMLVGSRNGGGLSVLLGEQGVPNPPAVLAEPAMAALLRSAAQDFDQVLIDAPPPLLVSDVLPLLANVDGIVLVARIGHTREASAKRLAQLLAQTTSAPVLGVVANDVSRADMRRYGLSHAYGYSHGYGYGHGSGYGRRGWRNRRRWGHQPYERRWSFGASRRRGAEPDVFMSEAAPAFEHFDQATAAEARPPWAPESQAGEQPTEARPVWAPEVPSEAPKGDAPEPAASTAPEVTQPQSETPESAASAPARHAEQSEATAEQEAPPAPGEQATPAPDTSESQPTVQHGRAPEPPARAGGPSGSPAEQPQLPAQDAEPGADEDEDEPRGWLDRLLDR
jgi:Mrp family chromosome partitioning ATPase